MNNVAVTQWASLFPAVNIITTVPDNNAELRNGRPFRSRYTTVADGVCINANSAMNPVRATVSCASSSTQGKAGIITVRYFLQHDRYGMEALCLASHAGNARRPGSTALVLRAALKGVSGDAVK